MKSRPVDLSWLPPAEEWDFRSVTPEECRVACLWEYQREIKKIHTAAIVGSRPPIPKPWNALTRTEREVQVSITSSPVLQIRGLHEALKSVPQTAYSKPDSWRHFTHGAYVMRPAFTEHGVEAVIKAFEVWARKESKKYERSSRAKAAAPPFDSLKWLAVYRLDKRRREGGLTYVAAQESILAYRRLNVCEDPNDVFPMYASHGAWSKARNDAGKMMVKVGTDASAVFDGLMVR